MMKTIVLNFKITLMLLLVNLMASQKVTAQQVSVKDYIEAHQKKAIHYMEKYGIPASITLGIAIHESANGNSKLARYLNNHFGIKGENDSKVIKSAYKGYDSVEDSYEDFVLMITSRKQYKALFDKYGTADFRNWALGIARGGYAGSKNWTAQVIHIIKKYDLHVFDHESATPQDTDRNLTSYIVRKGDTLSEIADQFNTTVSEIKNKNGLTNTDLQIGQQLDL